MECFDDEFIAQQRPNEKETNVVVFSYDYEPNLPKIKQINKIFRYSKIRELSLVGHGLTEARNLNTLFKIRKLNLSWNNLTDISPLSRLPNLEFLFLSHNKISIIPNSFIYLTKLQVLGMRSNSVSSIKEILKLTGNNQLRSLDLSFNPIGRDENGVLLMIYSLPQLKIINRGEITEELTRKAKEKYANLNIQQYSNVQQTENSLNPYNTYITPNTMNNMAQYLIKKGDEEPDEIKTMKLEIEKLKEQNKEINENLVFYKTKFEENNQANDEYDQLFALYSKVKAENAKLKSKNMELYQNLSKQTEETNKTMEKYSRINYYNGNDETIDFKDKDELLMSRTNKLRKAKQKIKEIEQEMKDKKEETTIEVNRVTNENNQIKSENKQLILFKVDALNVIQKLQDQIDSYKKELEDEKNKSLETDQFYINEFNKMRQLLNSQWESITTLAIQNKEAEDTKVTAKNQLIELENAVAKISRQNKILQEQLNDLQIGNEEDKQTAKEKYKANIDKCKAAIIQLSRELQDSQEKVAQETSKRQIIERKLTRFGENYDKLRQIKENLENELKEANETIEQNKEEHKKIAEELKRTKIKKESEAEIFKSLANKYRKLESNYDLLLNSDAKNKMLVIRAEEREKELAVREAAMNVVKDQLNEAKLNIAVLTEKIEAMTQELEKNKAVLLQQEQDIAVEKEKNKNLTKENAKLKASNQKLLSTVDGKITEIGMLKSDNTALELDSEKLKGITEELLNLKNVFSTPEFINARNSDKAHILTENINSALRSASISGVNNFILERPLRFYSSQHINVLPESETLLEKQKRILGAVRKELLSFPKVMNYYQPTEDDLESQLEQLHQLVSLVKKMFDEREKHILEMSDVVASQHRAVLSISQKNQNPNSLAYQQQVNNSIYLSNDNMKKAQNIMDEEIQLNGITTN